MVAGFGYIIIMKMGIISVILIIIAAGASFYFLSLRESPSKTNVINDESNSKVMQKIDDKKLETESNSDKAIIVETSLGIFKFKLFLSDAPKTSENFIKLANQKFYDGLIFHRVVPSFVIQAGDPFCAQSPKEDKGMCGTGGPGYQFKDELDPNTPSYQKGYKKGVVAMANAGPNTNGSQFFIILEDRPLPHNYTIFGEVLEGQNIVDTIGKVRTDPRDRPIESIVIKKITIE